MLGQLRGDLQCNRPQEHTVAAITKSGGEGKGVQEPDDARSPRLAAGLDRLIVRILRGSCGCRLRNKRRCAWRWYSGVGRRGETQQECRSFFQNNGMELDTGEQLEFGRPGTLIDWMNRVWPLVWNRVSARRRQASPSRRGIPRAVVEECSSSPRFHCEQKAWTTARLLKC